MFLFNVGSVHPQEMNILGPLRCIVCDVTPCSFEKRYLRFEKT